MRFFYTFSFFLLLAFKSFSQAFSVSDLIKMSKMNLEAFDTFVTSKGFDYYSQEKVEDGSVYSYMEYNKLDSEHPLRVIVILLGSSEPLYSISYTTICKEEYLKFKNETQSMGFNHYNTEENVSKNEDKSSSIVFSYKKDNEVISLTNQLNSYNISYSSIH